MPSQILLIDGDPTIQRLLGQILEQAGHRALVAPSHLDGLRLLRVADPELVLIDVALPSIHGSELVREIRLHEGQGRQVPVIMLASRPEIEEKIRCLRAGADDYLCRPTDATFEPEELLARIASLLGRSQRPEVQADHSARGRVIGFYGAKGGVGTTTLAVNSAIALQRTLGRSVCLVDGNLQLGDHRVFLDMGSGARGVIDAVSARVIDPDQVRNAIVRHETGISLLLGPSTPEAADLLQPEQLTAVLAALRLMYDYVVVDLGKRLDGNTLAMIESSDRVYLVMTADVACLKNVRLVWRLLGEIGLDAGRLRLVLNRSNAAATIAVRDVERALQVSIDHRIPNDFGRAVAALQTARPFVESMADSGLARSVLGFARSVDTELLDSGSREALRTPHPDFDHASPLRRGLRTVTA